MNQLLNTLIKREKQRQLIYSIGGAVLIALLILSISYAISLFDTNTNGDHNKDNDGPSDSEGYVLGLSSELDTSFEEGVISGFQIDGNITPSIHPRLIASEVTPLNGGWNVNAWVLNSSTMDPLSPYQTTFSFTNQQMHLTHSTFLEALGQTSEVNATDIPQNAGSVPMLLYYSVFLEDGTGYDFVWAGFSEVDIMIITHFRWSGSVTSTTSGLTIDSFSRGPPTEEHYISPLSAFDAFISQLQNLYGSILG